MHATTDKLGVLCISPEMSNVLFDLSQKRSKLLYYMNRVFKWAQSKRYIVFPSDERGGGAMFEGLEPL